MAKPSRPGAQVLLQGLDLLRLLARQDGPVSGASLAKLTGQHPSTVSRLLSALARASYVRKPDYHSYTVDLGLLTLLDRSARHFPLTRLPRQTLIERAALMPSMRLSLATLHEHQQIYWLTVDADHEPNELVVGGYPLHLSSVALRLLLEQPREQALAHLAMSRRWNGWERPTPAVPSTAAALLTDVRRRMIDGVLVLDGWQREGHLSAAVPVRAPDGRPLALAISGPSPSDRAAALAHLRAARDAVEADLFLECRHDRAAARISRGRHRATRTGADR